MARGDTDDVAEAGLRDELARAHETIAALTERVEVLEAHGPAIDQALADHRRALGERIDELARLAVEPTGGDVDQRARQILAPLCELVHDQLREMPARRMKIARRVMAAAGPLLPEKLRG